MEGARHFSGHLPGDDPIVFWSAPLAHWTGLGPGDMGGLLVSQYVETFEWIKAQTDA